MYENLHARLATIAEEDNDREELLGSPCPSRLTILLAGGHRIDDCQLVDGVNSLDDQSIDVVVPHEPDPERGIVWIVPLQAIVALRMRYPLEIEMVRAKAAAATPEPAAAA